MEKLEAPTQINLKLGHTLHERLESVMELKDAMAQAILMMVEHDLIDDGKTNPSFIWLQTIYLEAKHAEHFLKQF